MGDTYQGSSGSLRSSWGCFEDMQPNEANPPLGTLRYSIQIP